MPTFEDEVRRTYEEDNPENISQAELDALQLEYLPAEEVPYNPQEPVLETDPSVEQATSSISLEQGEDGTPILKGNIALDALKGVGDFVSQAAMGPVDAVNSIGETIEGAVGLTGNEVEIPDIPTLPRSENPISNVARHLTEFLTPAIPLSKVGKATTLLQKVGKGTAVGAASTFLTADQGEEIIANTLEKYPSAIQGIAAALAVDPDDGILTTKAKAAVEDALLGIGVEFAAPVLGYMKALVKSKQTGKELTDQAIKKATEEIQGETTEAVVDNLFKRKTKPVDLNEEVLGDTTGKKPALNMDKFNINEDTKNILESFQVMREKELNNLKASQKFSTIKGKALKNIKKELEDGNWAGLENSEIVQALQQGADISRDQAANVLAGKRLLATLGTRLNRVGRRYLSNPSEELKQELIALTNSLLELQGIVKANISGAARTTSAGRINVKELDIDKLATAAATQTPEQMMKTAADIDSLGVKAWNTAQEYWINALFSPTTQTLNLVGNTLNTAIFPATRILGGAVGFDKEEMLKGAATYVGMMRNLKDAFKMGLKAFELESNILDTNVRSKTVESNYKSISAEYWNLQEDSFPGAFMNAMGMFSRIPSRFLTTVDEFSKQLNYRAALEVETMMELGQSEMLFKGQLPESLLNVLEQKKKLAFDEFGGATDKKALQYAREVSLTLPLDRPEGQETLLTRAGAAFQKMIHELPAGRIIAPFTTVPTNDMQLAIENSLFSLAQAKTYRNAFGWWGGTPDVTTQAMQRGRLVIASGLSLTSLYGLLSGNLTGAGPASYKLRRQAEENGHVPYSMKVGDKWIPYNTIPGYGMAMGMTADLVDIAGHITPEEYKNASHLIQTSIWQNLTSKSYLTGAIRIADMILEDDPERQAYNANQWSAQFAASFIPNSLKLFNDDPVAREARGYIENLKKKAGLGDEMKVTPHRNMFGEPYVLPKGFSYAEVFQNNPAFTPVNITNAPLQVVLNSFSGIYKPHKEADTFIEKEIQRLTLDEEVYFGPPSKKYRELDLTTFKRKHFDGYEQHFHDRIMESLSTLKDHTNMTLKEKMEDLFNSKEYKNAPPTTKLADGTTIKRGTKGEMAHNRYAKDLEQARTYLIEYEGDLYINDDGVTLSDALQRIQDNEERLQEGKPLLKISN